MPLRRGFCYRLKQLDVLLLTVCALAAVYGVILVHSAVGEQGGSLMQIVCLILGITGAVGLGTFRPEQPLRWLIAAAAVSLLLMILTFTPLGYTVPGTDDRNWLYVSLVGKNLLFQPSELLKIVFIATFSTHLAAAFPCRHRPLALLLLCAHGLLPAVLVFWQGDDGNAVVFLLMFVSMMFVSGADGRFLLWGAGMTACAIPLVWRALSPEKKARFLCLFQVEAYLNTTGWQQQLSLIALGTGGFRGVGYGQGGQHNLYARHNDFIFTVAAEELGFLGSTTLLFLLVAILWLLYRAAHRASTLTGRFVCLGMLSLIGWQSAINLGMNLRLLPVLGITLPFFSAGGSSLLTLFLGVGVALSCSPRTV